MMETYISLTQAAKEIGITTTSLYKIINHELQEKRLEPVNRTTHRGDGGYRFRASDVEAFKQGYVKKDLTSVEAGRLLGRSATFIHKLIRDGVLDYYEEEYRGKRTFFIKEEELVRYQKEHPDSGKSEAIYDKRSGVFLFQPYGKEGSLARVVELKRVNNKKIEAKLKTIDNEILHYNEAKLQGWVPMISIDERKPVNGYGYARFEFPLPKSQDSIIFTIIEEFFKQVGPANMKLTQEDERIVLEVRKSVLLGVMPATHPDLIDKLKLFIRSGEVISKYDGTLIDTGLLPVTFFVSEAQKKELAQRAEEEGMSLQDWIMKCLVQA
jgi:hypothetical protein